MLVDCAFFMNCGQDVRGRRRVAVVRTQRARRQRLARTVGRGRCAVGGDGGGVTVDAVARRLYRVRFVTRMGPNELQAILCAQFRYGFFQ